MSSGEDDGIYGNATRQAVINFQKKKDLAADGLAGKATLDALYEASNATSAKKTITITANILNVRVGPGI